MGLRSTVTEASILAWLAQYGPVSHVQVVRDGNAAAPVAVVVMAIGDQQAFQLAARITNYWHDGALLNARVLIH
jgi:hypothetical protein